MSKKLLSEQQTQKVERLIKRAAFYAFGNVKYKRIVFEHGHWWLSLQYADGQERTFDVVDAYPSIVDTGLQFEEI